MKMKQSEKEGRYSETKKRNKEGISESQYFLQEYLWQQSLR